MLPSGGEAASTLVKTIAGKESDFGALINTLAEKLDITKTHFVDSTELNADSQQLQGLKFEHDILSKLTANQPSDFRIIGGKSDITYVTTLY